MLAALHIIKHIVVRALNTIFQKWGISRRSNQWNISGEPCSGAAIDSTSLDDTNYNPFIKCDCSANSNSTCHITQLCKVFLDLVKNYQNCRYGPC
ncbi:hypothetical protein RGQ29_018348 [Quercus rubra]|uniref:Uncharacterized protein n=1 Tax=Quercus rubra TaxID=3512 RepID=A0AAN7J1M2_QUERU|nr:hypothetical protein RGQ29_018348 [Quercus rubra]